MAAVRARFAHVATCPFEGERIFFENAGGALTLNSVVETSARYAAIPDNQGRANAASRALMATIERARADMALFLNAPGGRIFVGESGTELLFRMIRDACLGAAPGGVVLGSTVEHPASRSAAARWAEVTGREHVWVRHDDATGRVTPEAYAAVVTPEVRVATILHTSPVTGMAMDVAGIARAIRAVAPGALIVVDGIQHACHGGIDIAACDVDGYAISPYKLFSRHGFGLAWASDRLTALGHDALVGGPDGTWELGTRDTGAYATLSDVVAHFDWLGSQVSDAAEPRARIEAAADAIHAHERALTDAMLRGTDNLPGLASMPGVHVVGGADNPAREGLVSFWADGRPAADIVDALNAAGIRTHLRKADHYSGNILEPLGQAGCVRVSLAHYNTLEEVRAFLAAMRSIL
ncbi:aminotransferase class V-fold PLP-dependent enzyme [Roseivivax jejudonensis]|nr:aminotransferase class V-fold PLP-dependent enzyme [Roseivivax jejudonensis]